MILSITIVTWSQFHQIKYVPTYLQCPDGCSAFPNQLKISDLPRSFPKIKIYRQANI
jgi:hypothetical protein